MAHAAEAGFVHWTGMAAPAETDLPLFPLKLVALPHELVPLHIFEARYRVMVSDCLEQEQEFGILWSADDGLRDVGCAVTIADVLEELEDGRMNIVTRGTRPFTLQQRSEAFGYPSGTVEWLEDEDEPVDPDALVDARAAYVELVRTATERELEDDDVADMGAYRMAATVEFGPAPKQELLELRAENDRLRLVTELFGDATARLQLIGRGESKARSNGKVRFDP
jgi:Lon protease-like protein